MRVCHNKTLNTIKTPNQSYYIISYSNVIRMKFLLDRPENIFVCENQKNFQNLFAYTSLRTKETSKWNRGFSSFSNARPLLSTREYISCGTQVNGIQLRNKTFRGSKG